MVVPALINPVVVKLPPTTLPVDTTRPAVTKLPPVILPVASTGPAVKKLEAVMPDVEVTYPVILAPEAENTATFAVPPMVTMALLPDPGTETVLVPLVIEVTTTLLVTVTLLKNPPSPKINAPETLPPVIKFPPVTLPVATTRPAVFKFPPTTLPVAVMVVPALINPDVVKLPPTTLPVDTTRPAVTKLPPVMLPVAELTPVMSRPVVENTATFEVPAMLTLALPLVVVVILVVPLTMALGAPATTPVRAEPLPIKYDPVIFPLAVNVVTCALAEFGTRFQITLDPS